MHNPSLNCRKEQLDHWMRLLLPLALMLLLAGISNTMQVQGIGADTNRTFVRATVSEILQDTTGGQENQGTQTVRAVITQGPWKGTDCKLQNANTYQRGALCFPGTKILAAITPSSDGTLLGSVYNYDRTPMLYLLLILFAAVLLLVGQKRGAAALYALVFTGVCVFFLYLPLMYHGMDAVAAAIVTAVVILVVSNYIFNGWSVKTFCAILGTTAGVLLSGLLAWILGTQFHLTGFHTEDGEGLLYMASHSPLTVGNVLFAGILLSSLGAVMDVSLSIVSALYELHRNAPQLSARQLFCSGMNIGHDMMGTMSNTLILAYVGSATSTLLTVYAYQMPYLQVLGYNSILTELLCGLTGTIGVVLTVPLQTLITTGLLKLHSRSKIPSPGVMDSPP